MLIPYWYNELSLKIEKWLINICLNIKRAKKDNVLKKSLGYMKKSG